MVRQLGTEEMVHRQISSERIQVCLDSESWLSSTAAVCSFCSPHCCSPLTASQAICSGQQTHPEAIAQVVPLLQHITAVMADHLSGMAYQFQKVHVIAIVDQ